MLNCGVGNLASISASLRKVGASPRIVSSIPDGDFDGLILPGVGSYSGAFRKMDEERGSIEKLVGEGYPILGVCLGLQLMFNWSEEGNPGEEGLGLFKGVVRKLPAKRLPHIGWNNIEIVDGSVILDGLENNCRMYFVHSYAPTDYDPSEAFALANYCNYRFPVVFEKKNVFGTQFHPEKSWRQGLIILENFVKYCRR
ncbi:MAG: imidazole glycerol phosphate synthase subunit HisH [Crenarchaeota archaeon]|nr:imidazole glycerol phosphate synthase subunit HisH [Thermoproteota archaeon]MDW8033503.1 imidazole glycerol phosphate synthase subunit HisH [Nitrososphaerota archaeon]